MKQIILFLNHLLIIIFVMGCNTKKSTVSHNIEKSKVDTLLETKPYIVNKRGDKIEKLRLSDSEWHKRLSSAQYYVLREKGTEKAYSSEMWENKKEGLYACAACNQVLFSSNAKYDSGTGWPSFFRADDELMIINSTDTSLGYARTEVSCARCESHLGHVFSDGPPPTGKRYCINASALAFIEAKN